MSEGTEQDHISLVIACQRARLPYVTGRDAVLRGDLDGHQDTNGRWWVTADSVRRFIAEREARQDARQAS